VKVAKKLEGVRVNPGLGLTVKTEEFRIVKPIDTWAEVSPSTTSNPNQHHHIPVGLDIYLMVDLVSFSLVQSLGIAPCNKKKHQHEELMVEGIRKKKAKTYGFHHLKLCMVDQWNCSVQCICPFLAVDHGSRDSQVFLGRPALKDLKVSIDNSNDS
jgi:hypothetical protein